MIVKVNEEKRKEMNKTKWSTVDLLPSKLYEVKKISPKLGWYKIVDESGEDYLYPPSLFDIVEE